MSAKKRKRDVPVLFWVSDAEMEAIQQKMAQFGTKNLSAYLRKMAVDGYVVQLDLPELKELVSLLRRSSKYATAYPTNKYPRLSSPLSIYPDNFARHQYCRSPCTFRPTPPLSIFPPRSSSYNLTNQESQRESFPHKLPTIGLLSAL